MLACSDAEQAGVGLVRGVVYRYAIGETAMQ
jgi:hypothetical protein